VNEAGNLQSPALQPGLWMGLNRPDSRLGDLDLVVVGAPYDGGVSHAAGAAEAPAVLRSISARAWPHTENLIDFSGLRLRDRGDVALTNLDATSAQLAIRSAVEPIVEAGVIPLVLGGDHSITSAVLSAYARAGRMAILWMDSHPDLMDTFGAIRGKEESRWSHACPLRRILELPHVSPEDVLLVGVRDFIPDEVRFAQDKGLEVVYAHELSQIKAEALVDRVERKFSRLRRLYVSFDIDVLDPAHAPGTGVPIPGGISTRYLYDMLIEMQHRESRSLELTGEHFLEITGFDLVEVAPPLDVGQLTSLAAFGIITSMLGYLAVQLGRTG